MTINDVVHILTADFPAPIWFVPSLALVLLGYLAVVDALSGRIPDVPVFGGIIAVLGCLAWYAGWEETGVRFLAVGGAVLGLRLVGELFYRLAGRDALGFGDAKWTGLAVAAFGYKSVMLSWVLGAWFGLGWLILRGVIRKLSNAYQADDHLHFAPFLFLGLILALFRVHIFASIGIALAI